MNLQLEKRTALVTGASGDIGSAIARVLAAGGAHVALHFHRSLKRANALAREAVFQPNGSTLCQADLTSEAAVKEMLENLVTDTGAVHSLICNAGYLVERTTPLKDLSLEQWQRSIELNLTSTFLTLREFFRSVEACEVRDPSVVIIASMSGVWGQPGHADYAASKAAMVSGLLPTLKDEIVQIAPRGRVNLIAPGFVTTRMVEDKMRNRAEMRKVLQTASLRKFGTPEDIAFTAGFLASNALSGHITGEVIRMAGGKEGRILFDEKEIDF